MILYLIRHGLPDYETDTLKEEGWAQARAVARRLKASGLDAIYASPMQRACQTAQPTADILGLPIQVEPWARELESESDTTFPDGIPHSISELPHEYFHREPFVSMTTRKALKEATGLIELGFPKRAEELAAGIDSLLARHGYVRQPDGLYLAAAPSEKHIALFCHAGMTRVLLSHLMHWPIQLTMTCALTHYTGVTAFMFHKEQGPETTPVLLSFGDVGHLYEGGTPLRTAWHHEPW